MTDEEIFYTLFSGGNIALPYLIKFRKNAEDTNPLCFVNDNESVTYDGDTYQISTFNYTQPNNKGENGSLEITGIENDLVDFIEENDSYILDVTGIIKDGEVTPLKCFRHLFGSVSYADDMKIMFNLGHDDRLDMQFCPYKFDTDNNRANV